MFYSHEGNEMRAMVLNLKPRALIDIINMYQQRDNYLQRFQDTLCPMAVSLALCPLAHKLDHCKPWLTQWHRKIRF